MKTYLILLVSTLLVSPIAYKPPVKHVKDRPPNVLFILTDDQGSLDVNAYGSKDLATPSLDRLAKEGVRFTRFYAAAPVCSPSRAAILTGKTNLRAGLSGNVPVPEYADKYKKYGLPTEQETIAEMLKEKGYYTALIGKWHLGHKPDRLPNGQGFDYYFGHQRGCIDNYSHFFFWSGPNKHDLYRNEEEVYYPGEHFSELMTKEVIKTINEQKDSPFYIHWAFNTPHYPYQGTVKWLEHYKDLPSPRKEYAAFLSYTDEKIGEVLDELDRLGLTESTLVIFQSDHGHSREERAFWGGGNAGPYRGSKFSLFEGGIRVPAMVRLPGLVPANEVRDQACIAMDWFATIDDLTGKGKSDRSIDGKSLVPVLKKKNAAGPHEALYWQFGDYNDQKAQWAVQKGPWKLIGNVREDLPEIPLTEKDQLFLVNLEEDISEKINVADKNPDKVEELKGLHDQWLKNINEDGRRRE